MQVNQKYFFLGITLTFFNCFAYSNTYTVTNTNNSGAGSLRQAITDADSNTGSELLILLLYSRKASSCDWYHKSSS